MRFVEDVVGKTVQHTDPEAGMRNGAGMPRDTGFLGDTKGFGRQTPGGQRTDGRCQMPAQPRDTEGDRWVWRARRWGSRA